MAADKSSWALCLIVLSVLITLSPVSAQANFVTSATGNVDFGAGAEWNATDTDGWSFCCPSGTAAEAGRGVEAALVQ